MKDRTLGDETTAWGSAFQTRTIRHAKKWFLVLHLASGTSRRNECPREDVFRDGINISLIPTEVKPRTILKHKIKSEMRRRCSSDFSFKRVNRSV